MRRVDSSFVRPLLAVLVACVWLAAVGCGSDVRPSIGVGARPAETATAPSTTTPVTPAGPVALETAVASSETAAQLSAVEAAVRRIRGRGLERPVERTFLTSAGMRTLIDRELEDPEVLAEIRAEGLLLDALGLVPPGTDLIEAYRALLGSQVLGLYDPDVKALFVLANAQLGALELSTYGHEYHHALQDERFNLNAIDRATRDNRDAASAASALIEGDATYTQSQYVAQELGRAGALALLAAASAAPPPSGPPVLLDLLQFPYLHGTLFAQAVAARGGVATIDAAFGRIPASTEQVLHPEKYVANEPPIEVRPGALPLEWTALGDDVLGEYLLRRWVSQLGATRDVANAAAAGWGGDRYTVARGSDGQLGMAARILWDTTGDADEFLALFAAVTGEAGVRTIGGRVAVLSRVDARTTVLAVAAERAAAEALARALVAGS